MIEARPSCRTVPNKELRLFSLETLEIWQRGSEQILYILCEHNVDELRMLNLIQKHHRNRVRSKREYYRGKHDVEYEGFKDERVHLEIFPFR